MSNLEEQLTLIEMPKEKGKRKAHKRISHKRGGNINAYMGVLRLYKMRLDKGIRTNLTEIQKMYNVGKFPAYLLPKDIKDIALEDITFNYTKDWYHNIIVPYYKHMNDKKTEEYVEAEPADENQSNSDPRPLKAVMEEIKAMTDAFIAEMEKKVASMLEFNL